jgi:hypothetical protein
MAKTALSRFLASDLQLVVGALCAGWLVLCTVLLFTEPVAAQAYQPEKLQSKTLQIERELQPRLGPVRLHRIEELEDDVFVPRSGSTNIESPFSLYQIEQRRFFVNAGEVQQNVPARTLSNYIAVSQDGEQVYRLAGFPDSEANFRRLVSDYHLFSPRNPEDAQSRALYCARVVFGVEPKQWLLGEAQARMLAADYFFHQGDKDAFAQADHWWRGVRSRDPKINTNVTTTGGPDGSFLTRLPLLWAPLETRITPEIRELQIQVNRDGSCQRIADSPGVASTKPKP